MAENDLHLVAPEGDFEDGECQLIESDDPEIAAWKIDEDYYALDNVCTHQRGPLLDGRTEGTKAYCPWHGHQFDLETGEHGQLDRLDTETFEVVVDDGEVYIRA
jgi:nitrite reductase (NADH) small subunit